MTVCDGCGRKNVELGANVWLEPAKLCRACLCVWYDGASSWEELKKHSLASGDKWLKSVKGAT